MIAKITLILMIATMTIKSMEEENQKNKIKFFDVVPECNLSLQEIAEILTSNQQSQKSLLQLREEAQENLLLTQWANQYRPCIILSTEPVIGLSNEYKRYPLTQKTVIKEAYSRNQKKYSIELEKKEDFHATYKWCNITDEKQHINLLQFQSLITCLNFHKITQNAYFGLENGTIAVYNPLEKKIISLQSHRKSIKALDFIDDENILISVAGDSSDLNSTHEFDETFLWPLSHDILRAHETTKPFIQLEPIAHSKVYLCEHGIIRSHFAHNETYFGRLRGNTLGNDGLYEIPRGYLYGTLHQYNRNQLLFLLLLQRLHANTETQIIIDYGPKLANSPIIKSFEPSITKVFQQFLKKHGDKSLVYCGDMTFTPKSAN